MTFLSSDDFLHAAISYPGADHFFLEKEINNDIAKYSIQPALYHSYSEEISYNQQHQQKKVALGEAFKKALLHRFGKEIKLLVCLKYNICLHLTPTDITTIFKIAEGTQARNNLIREQNFLLSSSFILLTEYLTALNNIGELLPLRYHSPPICKTSSQRPKISLHHEHQSFIETLDQYESELEELNSLRKAERLNVLKEKAERLLKVAPEKIFLTSEGASTQKQEKKELLMQLKKVHQKLLKGLREELHLQQAYLLQKALPTP